VDEDLAEEYRAARWEGGFETAVFDYQAWFREQRLRLSYVPEREITAVYRGWMMKPEQYAVFYRELLSQKIRLITTPEMYEKLHLFPRVYPELLPNTARMLTFPLHSEIDVRACLRAFGRFLVKDYVKSVKGSEFPAYFDENCSQEAFHVWMELFYRYRGDLLTGGICIKEFLELKRYEGRTNEYRVFYVNGEPIRISRNSGQEGAVAVFFIPWITPNCPTDALRYWNPETARFRGLPRGRMQRTFIAVCSNTFRLYRNRAKTRTLPETFRQSSCFHACSRRKEIASWTVEKVLQCVQSH
jgi:hypothetical protein